LRIESDKQEVRVTDIRMPFGSMVVFMVKWTAVSKVSVGKAELGGAGVWGRVKNMGERTLKKVEITVYCLGPEGKPVLEKSYLPVLVRDMSFSDSGKPLKPGYSRRFGVELDDAPTEWAKKVDVKVTQVEFQ
jgi:hypothetical protein